MLTHQHGIDRVRCLIDVRVVKLLSGYAATPRLRLDLRFAWKS